ncbi:putative RNA methyltransferase pc1998 [Glycine soja]
MHLFEKTIERLPATVDSSITWHHAYASKEPFLWLLGSDLVVIDPPRKGLDASLIDALKNISSDCKSLLSSKAWYLEKAHGFNFFPGTQSIEVLAVFKRGPQKKKQGKKKKKHL